MGVAQGAIGSAADSWRQPLLDSILGSIGVHSSVFFRMTLAAPWGIAIDSELFQFAGKLQGGGAPLAPPDQLSGMRKVAFHVVASGECFLDVDEANHSIRLGPGDFVVLPQEHAHALKSDSRGHATRLLEQLMANPPLANGEWSNAGAGATTRLVCGAMKFDNAKTNPILAALPPMIHVKASDDGAPSWLNLTVQHVIDELDSDRPGVESVVRRLADILFIGAVRSYVEQGITTARSGWLAAINDEQIGRAVALLHSEPGRPWSVVMLADSVALSRSAFAARFRQLLGEPPLHYLTRVRLDNAAKQLRMTNDKLVVIASTAGYDSASAFTRAFERHVGMSPGMYRRTHIEH